MRATRSLAGLSVAVLIFGFLCHAANGQTNEWTWMSGAETPQPPSYGTLGTPASGNLPGARAAAISWTDSNGKLWLFGGLGFDSAYQWGYLNDLWEFDPVTSEWVWVSGSNAVDFTGVANGVPGTLNTPATGNIPAGRDGAVSWTDASGNFWLFGGYNHNTTDNYFNDLWEFNPSTNTWAWMSGSAVESCTTANCAKEGVYGQLGVAAVSNNPGSRQNATSWTDKQGNLWLFGGQGYDSTDTFGYLNDLWEFSPSTKEWAWMGGSSTITCDGICGQAGTYGTQGTSASTNIPGGRFLSSSWSDDKGNLWLFGGFGYSSTRKNGWLNDLWKFNPSANSWTWINGSNIRPDECSTAPGQCGLPGVYGTLQTPAAGNFPGQREGAATWTDGKGNLWLFGGNGSDSAAKFGYLNDLWEFNPSTNQWAWMGGSSTLDCASVYCGQPGVYGTLHVPALGNAPSSRTMAATWSDNKGNFWLFGGTGTDAVDTFSPLQDLWQFQSNLGTLPVTAKPTFTPTSGTYSTVQTVAINDATPGATVHYLINGMTPAEEYSGPIYLASSTTIEAIASANGYANSAIAVATYTLNVTPVATPTFSLTSGTYATKQTVSISDTTPGARIFFTTDQTLPTPSSTAYTGPITVSSSETILAIAVASGYPNSAVGSAVYTIGSSSTLGQWTWMGGSSQEYQSGTSAVYGTLKVPAAANIPGARKDAMSWTDASGNFWLYGGSGVDSKGVAGYLNDIWQFNPSTHQWTWMGGSDTLRCGPSVGGVSCSGQPGVYGTLGIQSAGSAPGARMDSAGWTDSAGHRWIFGGYGMDAKGGADGTQ